MEEALTWLQSHAKWLFLELKELGITLWSEHHTIIVQGIIGLILLWFVVKWVKKLVRKWKNRDRKIFFRKERILTRNELRFFKALQQVAAEKELCIFPMLRVSELLRVKKQSSRKKYYKYLNQISRKHIDFTLCRQDNNEIVCGIDLQDRTRAKEVQEKRNQFVNELFQGAGIPLIRMKSSVDAYDVEAIRAEVEKAMEQNQAYLEKLREQKERRQKALTEKKKQGQDKHPRKKRASKPGKTAANVKERPVKPKEEKEEEKA